MGSMLIGIGVTLLVAGVLWGVQWSVGRTGRPRALLGEGTPRWVGAGGVETGPVARTGGEELSVLRATHASLERQYARGRTDRRILLQQVKRYFEDRAGWAAVRDELEQARARLSERVAELEQAVTDDQEERRQVERVRAELDTEQRHLLAERETLAREQEAVRASLQPLREERRALVEQLRTAERELARLHATADEQARVTAEHGRVVEEQRALRRSLEAQSREQQEVARRYEALVDETAAVHYNLGILLAGDGEYERAVREFRAALTVRPDDADAHFNLGVVFAEHLGEPARAVPHFQRYLELRPNAPDAARVRAYLGGDRPSAAQGVAEDE